MTVSLAPNDLFDVKASPLWVETVTLAVRDLDQMARYYRDVIGLRVLSESPGRTTLGTALPLVVLDEDPSLSPRDPAQAGLYHTAFLLPSRADLAGWLAHARTMGATISGASDHGVSEALYLYDPEGNGIEIYRDKPIADWPRDAAGGAVFQTERLDLHALLAEAPRGWTTQPDATFIGHLHLQVGAPDPAIAFAEGTLGMQTTFRAPGGAWFGAGGYHHQLAASNWHSEGAGPRPDGMAGLRRATLRLRGLDTARNVNDPWGTEFALLPV